MDHLFIVVFLHTMLVHFDVPCLRFLIVLFCFFVHSIQRLFYSIHDYECSRLLLEDSAQFIPFKNFLGIIFNIFIANNSTFWL